MKLHLNLLRKELNIRFHVRVILMIEKVYEHKLHEFFSGVSCNKYKQLFKFLFRSHGQKDNFKSSILQSKQRAFLQQK